MKCEFLDGIEFADIIAPRVGAAIWGHALLRCEEGAWYFFSYRGLIVYPLFKRIIPLKNLARVLVSLLLFVFLTISLPIVDRFGISDGAASADATPLSVATPTSGEVAGSSTDKSSVASFTPVPFSGQSCPSNYTPALSGSSQPFQVSTSRCCPTKTPLLKALAGKLICFSLPKPTS